MKPTTAQSMIEGLKKGFKYRTEHGEFTRSSVTSYPVKYMDVAWAYPELDVLLSEIGDRLIVEEPRPKVTIRYGWSNSSDAGYVYTGLYCTPDMVPLVEKAVRDLGGLS